MPPTHPKLGEQSQLPVATHFRYRAAVVYLFLIVFVGLVTSRLVQLQILPNPELQRIAERQLQSQEKPAPYRLPVFDRNGEELAVSVPATSVYARPKQVKQKSRTSIVLAHLFGGTPEEWLKKLKAPRNFVWLQRQVSPETARKLSKRNLPGIYMEPENRRVYPNGSLASHVIGFSGIDGYGLGGLELSLDSELLKQTSRYARTRDGKGRASYVGRQAEAQQESKGIYTTLDRQLQSALEQELDATWKSSSAQGVIGIIMDPTTGEILAMGQRPTFDPNMARKFSPDLFVNRAISHLYEPGSTMKVLFAAEAIERKLLSRHSQLDCGGGKLEVADRVIREADASHQFRRLSLEEVIRYSSNVGAVRVAQALGARGVSRTLEKFGLTSKLDLPVPAEANGGSRPSEYWTPVHLATAGFGQGISATPIQMVSAFATFANGGFRVRPKLLVTEESRAESREQILSPSTVAMMKSILTGVVQGKRGTGLSAAVEGVTVAGKTGTAQKYVRGAGYRSGKYFSSFIGFLPAESPRFVIGVMVDEPTGDYYGSQVAAPLFSRIATRALHIRDGFPKPRIQGSTPKWDEVSPYLASAGTGELETMPNLIGLSLREAVRILGPHSRRLSIEGSGYLSSQSPAAGTPLKKQNNIQLQFLAPEG